MRRRAALAVTAAAALLVAFLVDHRSIDFAHDWMFVEAFQRGIDPYQKLADLAVQLGDVTNPWNFQPWVHPRLPGMVILQAPLGLLAYTQLPTVGTVLVVFSALLCMWTVGRLAGKPWLVYTTPVLLVVWPLSRSVWLGQTGFWIAALIGLTWLAGDRWAAGVPLGVAVIWKLWPWVSVPALWLAGRRKAAVGAAATFGVLNAAGFAVGVPFEGVWRVITGGEVYGSWSIVTYIGWPTWFSAFLALLAVIAVWRYQRARLYEWSIIIGLLTAPTLWPDYLPAVFIAAAMVAYRPHLSTRPVQSMPSSFADA